VLQFVNVGKLLLYFGQLFPQPALHRRTRLQAIPSQPQECSNLAKFESQTLHATDKGQRLDVVLRIAGSLPRS